MPLVIESQGKEKKQLGWRSVRFFWMLVIFFSFAWPIVRAAASLCGSYYTKENLKRKLAKCQSSILMAVIMEC